MQISRTFGSRRAWVMGVAFQVPLAFANGAPADTAWNATLENDVFFGSDRNYTNGVQVEWVQGHDLKDISSEAPSIWRWACTQLGCGGHQRVTSHHKLGQLMYTPENIEDPAPQPLDRPWAGLLYYAQEHVFLSPEGTESTRLVGQFGVIGPAAFSKDTQTLVHRLVGAPRPLGWKNQSGNELVGLVMVERKSALAGFSGGPSDGWQWRSSRQWRLAAGTLMTFAGVGLEATVGTNLSPLVQDDGSIDIKSRRLVQAQQPQVANAGVGAESAQASPTRRTSGRCGFDWLDCSLTAGLEGRWMLHNVFLDGPVFRRGPSVDSKPFVADASLSLQLTFPQSASADSGPWFVKFKATRRTSEFRSPVPNGSHSFGALTVGRHFY